MAAWARARGVALDELRTGDGSAALAATKQYTPRSVEVSAFASVRRQRLSNWFVKAKIEPKVSVNAGRQRRTGKIAERCGDEGNRALAFMG